MNHRAVILSALLLAACGDSSSTESGENVTDLPDASGNGSGSDPGGVPDTSPEPDASSDDTSSDDAAAPDVDGADAAALDASVPDSGTVTDASSDSGTEEPTDDCPAYLFIEPDPAPGNSAYDDPMLAARCEGDELVVESNGIIGYEFQAITPNPMGSQDYEWRVPLVPTWSETTTDVPLLGVIGFSVTGLPLYGPNEAATPDPFGDPVYNGIVDWCLGHTAPGGVYHLHAMLVECIVDSVTGNGASPIIGFALDGYPIYGPVACANEACTETLTVRSGWVQTGDPSTYAWDNHEYTASDDPSVLDQCNGRTGPDGEYAYHATESFPYILGCYHGVAVVDAGGEPVDPVDPGDPTDCTNAADCVGECGAAATSCVCGSTPRGNRCVPGCTQASDCPTDAPTTLTCVDGACVPARP